MNNPILIEELALRQLWARYACPNEGMPTCNDDGTFVLDANESDYQTFRAGYKAQLASRMPDGEVAAWKYRAWNAHGCTHWMISETKPRDIEDWEMELIPLGDISELAQVQFGHSEIKEQCAQVCDVAAHDKRLSLKNGEYSEMFLAELECAAVALEEAARNIRALPAADKPKSPNIIKDLAALVRRLATRLKSVEPQSDLPEKATDFLKRSDLAGTPFREN